MAELLVLRHGQAEDPLGMSDFERLLTDAGKRDAQRIGHYLGCSSLVPDYIVTSPARRAADTAEKCIKAAGGTVRQVHRDDRIYNAHLADLRDVLDLHRESGTRLMLVGHNPGVSELVMTLTGDRSTALSTANLARIDPERGVLIEMVRPGDLPRGFESEVDGERLVRDRPAYYYTQSGVLPYRETSHGLEILLIARLGRNKWSIPKGIIEPGMTAAASAEKEAEEEAGACGTVEASTLGDYRIAKWGGTCTVTVYPMQVTDLHEEDMAWESHKRERHWFTAAKARDRVRPTDLAAMIGELERIKR